MFKIINLFIVFISTLLVFTYTSADESKRALKFIRETDQQHNTGIQISEEIPTVDEYTEVGLPQETEDVYNHPEPEYDRAIDDFTKRTKETMSRPRFQKAHKFK